MVHLIDDFTDSDGVNLTAHTPTGGGDDFDWEPGLDLSDGNEHGCEIGSNQAVSLSYSGSTRLCHLADIAAETDGVCTVKILGAGNRGPMIRGAIARTDNADKETGYILARDNSLVRMYKIDGTSAVEIAAGSENAGSGDKLGIRAEGSTLTIIRNGSDIGSAVDATYASGQPGFRCQLGGSGGIACVDDFEYASIESPSPSTNPPHAEGVVKCLARAGFVGC